MKRFIHANMLGVLTAAGGLVLLWPVFSVKAFNPQPDPPAFGLIGIDPFETARLNAVCADTPLPGGAQPGPCLVSLAFRDTSGRVLTQVTQSLQPGQATSLDLNGAQVAMRGSRFEVQPYVPSNGSGYVMVTTEVFETSNGHTSAVLNPTQPKSLFLTGGQ
ncbi:MAG: hypothetical protein C5B51_20375 [Terriglobia bacterium]|nr:MAG: hypothetical protein C5B51_20375 [Terriglobia bacterium]